MSILIGDWKGFTRKDFPCHCPGDGKGKPADHYDWCEAEEAAEQANAILEEKLNGAEIVHGRCFSKKYNAWLFYTGCKTKGERAGKTHTARLVCIEEIPRIAAENLEGGM